MHTTTVSTPAWVATGRRGSGVTGAHRPRDDCCQSGEREPLYRASVIGAFEHMPFVCGLVARLLRSACFPQGSALALPPNINVEVPAPGRDSRTGKARLRPFRLSATDVAIQPKSSDKAGQLHPRGRGSHSPLNRADW